MTPTPKRRSLRGSLLARSSPTSWRSASWRSTSPDSVTASDEHWQSCEQRGLIKSEATSWPPEGRGRGLAVMLCLSLLVVAAAAAVSCLLLAQSSTEFSFSFSFVVGANRAAEMPQAAPVVSGRSWGVVGKMLRKLNQVLCHQPLPYKAPPQSLPKSSSAFERPLLRMTGGEEGAVGGSSCARCGVLRAFEL